MAVTGHFVTRESVVRLIAIRGVNQFAWFLFEGGFYCFFLINARFLFEAAYYSRATSIQENTVAKMQKVLQRFLMTTLGPGR